jgi:pre-mRNA cleavage complex 2 protein Pcf11
MYNPSALQCKNCGLRYSPTDMIAYSQHLDWHFRMKRREKENARKAQSRNWYFERIDWINSDEISDGEKGKNKSNLCFNNVEVISSFKQNYF